ncbi:MAG TPA: DUF5011 domain-containing protein [Clostridiales bacterium]|nr:DUF5011 domain-containing protein [Clostridiales bacterium]
MSVVTEILAINLKKRSLKKLTIVLGALVLLAVGYLGYETFRPKVVNEVIIEAGSPMADVKEFLFDKNANGEYATDIRKIDLSKPGTYEVQIAIGNKIYTSKLIVVDSTPPAGVPVDVMVLKGDEIQAESFVKDVSDATEVTVAFSKKPNTKNPGNYKVNIILTDTSRNKTTLTANLTVLEVKSTVQVEAGTQMSLTTQDFVEHGNWPVTFVTDLNSLDISKPAEYEVKLNINNRIVTSTLEVVDTTPPSAKVADQEVWLGDTIDVSAFIEEVTDVSEVKSSFLKEPDTTREGVTDVTIVFEDTYGNKSQYQAKLTVKKDTQPPVFSGIKDIVVFEGESVSYKNGITAVDDKDGEVDFKVNSSKVNLRKPGEYEITYTAVDAAGNEAIQKAKVIVKKLVVTTEMVYEMADNILAKITKSNMTKREKAYEIFKYVRRNIKYTGTSDKSSVIKEAYRAVKYGVGDCFTYYSLGEVLLTRAGIDNMMVTRVGGQTRHYWSLINCGDGWYHFDASPHSDPPPKNGFMMTDKEVEDYTNKVGRNYYTFDKSKYPATPDK